MARQLSAPLVEERRQYLSLRHSQEFSRSSLRLTAQLLIATAEYLNLGDPPHRYHYAARSRVAEYALRDPAKPIGISGYRVTESLPADMKGNLPTIEELEAELKNEESSA
jgi:hypothetical protein